MAESNNENEQHDEGRTYTVYDSQIEALEKRMTDIEKSYQERIKTLEEANRGLWAQLHPVQDAQPQQAQAPQTDRAEEALAKALGIKEA